MLYIYNIGGAVVMNKKISLRTWMIIKILPAILLFSYYWMFARNDYSSLYEVIQNSLAGLTGIFFAFQFFYGKKIEIIDEFTKEILYKTDSLCLKICYTLLVIISFVSVIFELSGIIIGYLVVGTILLLTIIRAISFCIIDSKGI